jgi:uncharacterized protein YjbI with pentapeptide repeats
MMLRARSIAEQHLYMRLHPCRCGRAIEVASLGHATAIADANDLISSFSGRCPGCASALQFDFLIADSAPRSRAQYGGATPSAIIEPAEFDRMSDELAAQGDLERAIACLEEVLKFEVPLSRPQIEAKLAGYRARMPLPLPVRSRDELLFFAEEVPCEQCGAVAVDRLSSGVQGDTFRAVCAECKHTRSFRFMPFETQPVPAFALAPGDQPSRVFTAEQLLAIADRELAHALADPTAYATLEQYEAARRHVIRGRTALVELAKFRPGMTEELAFAEALWNLYKQAKAVVEAKPGALPEPRGLGERLKQHRAWDLRGRAGDGRLTFRTESWSGLRMPSAHLEAAIIEDTTFERMDLSFGKLAEAVIQRSKFLGCLLTYGELGGARITASDFTGSSFVLADLHGIQVEGGDWHDLEAARSTWRGARLTGVDLQNAQLVDVILDDTTFERCDLRGADLGRRDTAFRSLGIARRTRFIGCDLRGARIAGLRMSDVTFERCQLDGLIGDPVLDGAVTIDGTPWLAR